MLHVDDDPRDLFSVEEIAKLFTAEISRNLIKSALLILKEDQFISRSGNQERGYTFRITQKGIIMVEVSLRNRESDLSHFHKYQDHALDELAGPDSTWMNEDERLDSDSWRPLPIDRQDPEYVEVLAEVEAAFERIRSDNGFAENLPEQRTGILAVLADGLDWLKNKTPSKKQIKSLLIDPLWAITTRFRETLLAEASSKAAKALVKWLSSF